MRDKNPFISAYITEKVSETRELLPFYSFLPYQSFREQLEQQNNAFLAGRKGVGKSMLLKVYEPEMMSLIWNSNDAEHITAREAMPRAVVGAYFNLSTPDARLSLFRGRGRDDSWWLAAYSDYLNCILFEKAVAAIRMMCSVKTWSKASGFEGRNPLQDRAVIRHIIASLRRESSGFDSVTSITSLENYFLEKKTSWMRFLNDTNPLPVAHPPDSMLMLGIPLFALTSAINSVASRPSKLRLFILIDQYEALFDQRKALDLRPIFNQAMHSATRGGVGVEFKIGTRHYAFRNLNLPGSSGQIEFNREAVILDMDTSRDSWYPEFAEDLFRKRLASIQSAGSLPRGAGNFRKLVPGLKPRDEAEAYRGKSGQNIQKHLRCFERRWSEYGFADATIENIMRASGLRDVHPLTATIACIGLTRWIRDGRAEPLFKIQLPGRISARLDDQIIENARELVRLIEWRYEHGEAKARKHDKTLRAIDDFIHDVEEAALFILASSYKNQRKIVCGFDSILKISSGVALVLIEILFQAYKLLIADGGDPLTDPIPIKHQSTAVYQVAGEWYAQMPLKHDYGITIQTLIRGLGRSFSKLQVEPTVPEPAPNGFSVKSLGLNLFELDGRSPRSEPRALISEAVSWGFLEEKQHQDKSKGSPPRASYRLNRVLCPYFGITPISKKDPMYVDDIVAFVSDTLAEKTPVEIQRRLKVPPARLPL